MNTSANKHPALSIAADFTRIVAAGIGASLVFSLILTAIVLLLSGTANAAVSDDTAAAPTLIRPADAQSGSLLFKTGQPGEYVEAPTLKTDVYMRVTGMVTRTHVVQHFHNPSKKWVEGVYVFPLPENAAVDHLDMRIGKRIIAGQIKEKEQARATYEKARQEGKKATLLEQERPNIFTSSVANIGPGEDIAVEIEYQQTLHYDQGIFRLRFPMVVAPRYIPGTPSISGFSGNGWARDTDAVPDASRITPPVQHPSNKPINPVSIKVELDAGFPLARLESSYHPIDVQNQENNRYLITLKQGQVPANKDFELVWAPSLHSAPQAALFTERKGDKTYALLMVMPPAPNIADNTKLPREVVFVIDTSGSMEGTSIEQARQALLMALSRLGPQDRFNVIQFNSSTDTLFPQPVPVNNDTIGRARNYVSHLHATGGTEMAPALDAALSNASESNAIRQVIFLTDGSVGNEEQLFGIIHQKLGNSRLFTIGIGSAPNSHFMSKAAEFGHGTFTYIGDVGEVKEKMSQLFSKLESPALTNIEVKWPGTQAVEMWPNRIPDLYLGEPVLLSARLEDLNGEVVVQGTRGGNPWHVVLPLKGGKDENGVAALWARKKISSLIDSLHDGANPETVRQEVTELALAHHLVSKYTSLVAVDVTPSRPAKESLNPSAMPVNLPDGWNYESVFGTLPQTATPAQLNLMLGMLALSLAGILALVRRSAIARRPVAG
jgi:Ca-activated chloride channel family protein